MDARTYLFVPANRPERFAKAFASGADVVVIDLEDAVADAAKSAGRDAVARWMHTASGPDKARLLVRINGAGTAAFADDLRLLREAGVAAVMLAKAEAAGQVGAVRAALPDAAISALLESARGIDRAAEIAASAGVVRLVLGSLDLALDLDLDIAAGNEALVYAAGQLTVASRLAGLASPVAGVTPQLDDEARLLADLAWSRRHGFGAKLCIHPRQVEPVHAALAPSTDELAWARRVVAAEAASPGAARLDGRMIDRPVVRQAERTLQRRQR